MTIRSRAPGRLRATARAGAVGGLLSGGPSTAWAVVRGDDPLAASLAAGSLLVPDEKRRFRLLVAAGAAHTALSVGWALVLAGSWPRRPVTLRGALGRGAAWGVLIAAIDLGAAHGVTHKRMAGVRSLPVAPQVADHVAYGVLVAMVLRRQTNSMASAMESSTRPGR